MNDHIQPASIKPCSECGGERVRAQAGPYGVQLTPETNSFFKPSSGIIAIVCTNCGYVSWYATEPEKLINNHKNNKGS